MKKKREREGERELVSVQRIVTHVHPTGIDVVGAFFLWYLVQQHT